jgi:hypothetical protein
VLFETIGSFLVERLYHFLPRWLERRMLPPSKVQAEIDVDLRRLSPVNVSGGEVPSVSLWFEITNRSQIVITLDRLLLEVWFGQPTFRGAILSRIEIQPRSTTKDAVYFWTPLDGQQVAQIKRYLESGTPGNPVAITAEISAYFVSRLGWLRVDRHLNETNVRRVGI